MKTHIRTKAELAKTLTISRPTLDAYLRLSGAPKPSRKGWELSAITAFIESQAVHKLNGVKIGDEMRRAKLEEVKVRVARLRVKLEEEQGLTIPKALVETWQMTKAEQLKMLLRAKFENELPLKLEGLRAAEMVSVLHAVTIALLTEFKKPIVRPKD